VRKLGTYTGQTLDSFRESFREFFFFIAFDLLGDTAPSREIGAQKPHYRVFKIHLTFILS